MQLSTTLRKLQRETARAHGTESFHSFTQGLHFRNGIVGKLVPAMKLAGVPSFSLGGFQCRIIEIQPIEHLVVIVSRGLHVLAAESGGVGAFEQQNRPIR